MENINDTKRAISIINLFDINLLVNKLESKGKNYKASVLNEIRYSMVDVIKDKLLQKQEEYNSKVNDMIVKNVINDLTKKDGSKLNEKSYSIYQKKAQNMNLTSIINKFIEAKDNVKVVSELINELKQRKYLKTRKETSNASYLSDFIFINQILEKEPIKSMISSYIFKRLGMVIAESKKALNEKQLNKTLFEPLKIQWNEYKDLLDSINAIKTNGYYNVEFDDGSTKKIKITLDDKLLFNLYYNLPLRDNFNRVYLVDEDLGDTDNFINLTTGLFNLNIYKTSALEKHGKRVYRLTKGLLDLVKQKKEMGFNVLFGKNFNEFLTDGLSKKVRDTFYKYVGKEITINDIRRSVISWYAENKSVKKQKQLAELMLHDYTTARNVYKREENAK